MALEPGGYADKLGNRYEGRWVARQLLFLLAEQIKSVQIEAVGDDERGVDLWATGKDGIRVAQQCKVRNGHTNSWSPADLQARGVLGYAQSQLQSDPSCRFQFVTAVPSTTLEELCRSARQSSGDPTEYYKHQVYEVGHERRKTFADICKRLGLCNQDPVDLAKAYDFLRRFEINIWPDNTALADDLRYLAFTFVHGNPDAVLATLCTFAQDNLRVVIDAPMLRDYLRALDLPPRNIDHDPRVGTAIDSLRDRFRDSISNHLINGELIPRQESAAAVEAIDSNDVLLILGEPGSGKSGVLLELLTHLEGSGAIYLPLRLDREDPRGSTSDFGAALGLPESPVRCLHAISGGRRCVLVLDQLDALRWTARHSRAALEVCRDLLREVHGLRQYGADICIVMACRTYDREHDPEIRGWLDADKERWPTAEIRVEGLSQEEIQSAVAQAGLNPQALSPRLLELLASPQNLSMWLDLARESSEGKIDNSTQLLRRHWEWSGRELVRLGADPTLVAQSMAKLVSYMEARSSLTAPDSLLDTVTRDLFLASGVLDRSGARLAFSHQSHLDYQVASRVLSEIHAGGLSILEWLGPKDGQTLFRREQLRYALLLLADEDEPAFRLAVDSVLDSPEVRFHLKHLCLEVVGQLAAPSRALVEAMVLRRESPAWTEHVDSTVFWGHAPFAERLLEMGTLQDWLASESDRNRAFWLLRSVAESIPDAVTRALTSYADQPDLQESVLGALAWNAEDDSKEMFDLRLRLARNGVYKDYVNWKAVVPARRLGLLESIMQSMNPEDFDVSSVKRSGGHRSRIDHWSQEDLDAMLEAAREHPLLAWDIALEAIERFAPENGSTKYELSKWLDRDRNGLRQSSGGLPHGLVLIAIEAGGSMAQSDSSGFWNRTAHLRDSESQILQCILAGSFTQLDQSFSEDVVLWLLNEPHRFELGTGISEPKWLPTQRLLKAHEHTCSDQVVAALESAIIKYRPRSFIRNAKCQLSGWKHGFFGDYWGRCQYFLLRAIPAARLSDGARSLLGVLERKYESYDSECFVTGHRVSGGSLGSTLGTGERISDAAWLRIVGNTKVAEDRGTRWVQIDHDHIAESSIRQFSETLEAAAKREPQRFAQLSLRFPCNVHPWYISSVLDAVRMTSPDGVPDEARPEWVPATPALVEQVLNLYTDSTNRQFAMSLCWLLRDRAEEDWSEDVLDRLADLAASHADPELNKLVVSNDGTSDFDARKSSPFDLDTNALNSVRSVAGLAIGAILQSHPEHLQRFRMVIESLTDDRHPAVRTGAVTCLLSVLNLDRDFAIQLFVRACKADPRVAATRHAVYFFNTGMTTHAELLSLLIRAMLQSPYPEVARKGAQEVAARWLFHGFFEKELAECLNGSESQRIGVANVMAQFVAESRYHKKTLSYVRRLLQDPSAEVRAAAYRFVRNGELMESESGRALVHECIGTPAFKDDPTHVLYALDDHAGSLTIFADTIFAACSRFAGDFAEASRNMSRGFGLDAGKLGRLLLRLYEEAETESHEAIRSGCLDAWDTLIQARVGVRNMFET